MGDQLILKGSMQALPPMGALGSGLSADLGELGDIDERLLIGAKLNTRLNIPTDAVFSVPILTGVGGPFVAGVNVLVVKPVGGKVKVRVTSADGATQAIPVDSYLSLISLSVPITAVDFTRVSGVTTTIKLFMAEKL